MISNKVSNKSILVIGLVQVVAFLTLILSVVTTINEIHRYLELFSHFRLQYLLCSFVCLFLFIVFKNYKSAAAMVVMAGLNSIYVVPWYFSPEEKVVENYSVQIKVMHSNVNTRNTNYQKFIDLVFEESPDILIAQEVNGKWMGKLQELKTIYPYKYSSPREDNFGIAVFSKYPYADVKKAYWGASNLLSLKVVVTISGHKITTIATHLLPPVSAEHYISRKSQIDEVSQVLSDTKGPLILIGDLNVTMWSSDYVALESGTNLTNTRKGFGVLPTWPTMLPIFMIPIDHCLVSSHFAVLGMKVGYGIGSDHLPIIVKLGLKN